MSRISVLMARQDEMMIYIYIYIYIYTYIYNDRKREMNKSDKTIVNITLYIFIINF